MSDNEELMGEQQENENGESDLMLLQKAPPDNLMKLRIPTTEEQTLNGDELMSLTDKINQAVLKLAIQSQERENHHHQVEQ